MIATVDPAIDALTKQQQEHVSVATMPDHRLL
jgi:hypothetical protein